MSAPVRRIIFNPANPREARTAAERIVRALDLRATAQFVVNVIRKGTQNRRRTIHRSTCRWVGRARRAYPCDADEAARLISRAHLDGRTVCCAYCFPGVAGYLVDST